MSREESYTVMVPQQRTETYTVTVYDKVPVVEEYEVPVAIDVPCLKVGDRIVATFSLENEPSKVPAPDSRPADDR